MLLLNSPNTIKVCASTNPVDILSKNNTLSYIVSPLVTVNNSSSLTTKSESSGSAVCKITLSVTILSCDGSSKPSLVNILSVYGLMY